MAITRYLIVICLWCYATISFAQRTYDVGMIVSDRVAGETNPAIQQVLDPIDQSKGQKLGILHPDDSFEIIVDPGTNGAIFDPVMSRNGLSIYYTLVHNQAEVNGQVRARIAKSGADIYRYDLVTHTSIRLTNQEFTPNTGVAAWNYAKYNQAIFPHQGIPGVTLGYGIYNCGACPVPDGKGGERIVFCSNRNGFRPPKQYSFPNLQLFIMDSDGKNVECIGHLNIGSALHPILQANGMLAFSSWEMQGLRDQRMWGLWEIKPDGTEWGPLFSAFNKGTAMHWQTQLTDNRLVLTGYYNLNNWGFGSFYSFYRESPDTIPTNRFGSWLAVHPTNPVIRMPAYGSHTSINWILNTGQITFSPVRLAAVTEFANDLDIGSALNKVTGVPMGKVTQPMAAPNNHILCVYSPGRVNKLPRPIAEAPWCQIALFDATNSITDPSQMTIIKADPTKHYQQPFPVVSWQTIYGSPPTYIPPIKNDGSIHPALTKGTPYGLVGTSSVYKRDSAPGYRQNGQIVGNLTQQGADVGLYNNSEIWGIRIVQLEPRSDCRYEGVVSTPTPGRKAWSNAFSERERILGEFPVRKDESVGLDPDGNPDTSFLVRIPSDVPFGIQLLDYKRNVRAREATWKQLRAGEKRNNCGGCHAHSQPGTDFNFTFANTPEYVVETYDQAKNVEFIRDIKPIIDNHCASCHDENHPTGLVLNGDAQSQYNELFSYTQAGLDLIGQYAMPGRAAESLLIWKLYGERTDGRPGTINGERMPKDAPPLSDEELRLISAFIDTGAAYGEGIHVDDLRPTLSVTIGANIYVGAIDTESGLNGPPTLKIDGNDIVMEDMLDHRWKWKNTLALGQHELVAEVSDVQGNITKVVKNFELTETPVDECDIIEQQISNLQQLLEQCRKK